MLVKLGNVARRRELEYPPALKKQVPTFLKPTFGSFKPIFCRQLRDLGEIGEYCLKKRELENKSVSEGSKQVPTFLKPRFKASSNFLKT